MWPKTRDLIEKAIAGHPIEVTSTDDYLNLYHVFGRFVVREPSLKAFRIIRRQIDHARWRLVIRRSDSDAPDYNPEGTYNPKRGRYKRYARRLHAGERLVLESRAEAVKARRAWQLYVPPAMRRNLAPTVEQVGAGPAHRVWLIRRSDVR